MTIRVDKNYNLNIGGYGFSSQQPIVAATPQATEVAEGGANALTMAKTGISNKMVCNQGPWIVMSISPEGNGMTWMYFSFSLNRSRKSTKSLLIKRIERK